MGQLPSFGEAPFLYGILVAGLVVVVVVLYLLLRKRPETAQPVAVSAAAPRRDATVVFSAKREAAASPPAPINVPLPAESGTYLIPLAGDDATPGAPLRVTAQSVYIGRDQQRAQIVFDDPSVSRLHARLIEESEGVFMLHDEGSASGTYVNGERVDLRPRQLRSGDLIEFGRQRVVFQSSDVPRGDLPPTGLEHDQDTTLLSAGD